LRGSPGDPKRKVLEVGAINTQLLVIPWLNTTSIDIESRHPRIQEIDFFDLPPAGEYDIIVNSMVINCVMGGLKRGLMLLNSYRHLKPGGYLFLAFPNGCLSRSKYMNAAKFKKILTDVVGFELCEEMENTPKVAFFTCRRPLTDRVSVPLPVQYKEPAVVIYKDAGSKMSSDFCVTFS
jgi:25S rRNA (adenine2142-N1)-methyltransferase